MSMTGPFYRHRSLSEIFDEGSSSKIVLDLTICRKRDRGSTRWVELTTYIQKMINEIKRKSLLEKSINKNMIKK